MNGLVFRLLQEIKYFGKNKELFFLSLPGVIFIFIFCYIPMAGLVIAFKDFRYDLGFWRSKWVGFDNFKFFLTSDTFLRVTRNTVAFNLLFIFGTLAVSVVFALILNELSSRHVKIYQTIMFFPYFLSWVVVGYIFMALLDMDKGFFNTVLKGFGIEPIFWYNEPGYWPVLLMFANIWKGAGYFAIIYYTALIGINQEYYEAAELDGASKLQQIRNISIPLILPLVIIMLLLSIGKIFNADFGMFFQLTKDSAALYPTTDVIDTYVYRALTKTADISMASAAGFYQSLVGFIMVLISNALVKKLSSENSLF